MSYKEYFGDWLRVIDEKELISIIKTLNTMYKNTLICPNQSDVFKAFKLCPYDNLKIIMLGQDPYPQKDVATGILFGNKKEVNEENLSPSLQVIKEAVINFEIPHNLITFDNSLEEWAKQGILMINSALTVEMNKIGSHSLLWKPFISRLLENLSERTSALVYVLFGKQAQSFKSYINSMTNYIIEIEHPAYFARTHTKMPYTLFKNINKIINGIYGVPIEWYKETN